MLVRGEFILSEVIMKKFYLVFVLVIYLFAGCKNNSIIEKPKSEEGSQSSVSVLSTAIPNETTITESLNMGVSLPDNPTNWQIDYADYFETIFFEYSEDFGEIGVYVRDVNNDCIPEIFIYTWAILGWEYPQFIVSWTENGIVETSFAIGTSNPGYSSLYFAPKTNQLIVKITGHTAGIAELSYVIYDSTPYGYAESVYLSSWGFSDIAHINGEDISYTEFLKAVEQHVESLEPVDLAGKMVLGNYKELSEYLNSMLFKE